MFGYIKPKTGNLTVDEFEQYKGVYCSLCKSLGKRFGPFSRLTLSYDFTFAALLYEAVSDDCPGFKPFRCKLNPAKKRIILKPNKNIDFISGVAIIMIYYKIRDDIADERFFKRILRRSVLPFFGSKRKKAAKAYPEAEKIIRTAMEKQSFVEKTDAGIDAYSNPSAEALSGLFGLFSEDKDKKAALKRLGYMLGRWVYIIDAVNDFYDDVGDKKFNPLKNHYKADSLTGELLKKLKETLNLTAYEVCESYISLKTEKFDGILKNVVFEGLYTEEERVFKKISERDKFEK